MEVVSWWHVVREHKEEKRLARRGAEEGGCIHAEASCKGPGMSKQMADWGAASSPVSLGHKRVIRGCCRKRMAAEAEEGLRELLRGL